MTKKIPEYIPEKKLFAVQLNATWQAIAASTLLGIDESTLLPKALFDIGDIDEVVGGSMVNDMIARNTGKLSVYDSAGLPVGSTTWETLLSAGISLYPDGYIKGFVPQYVTGGQKLIIGGGKCRSSDNTTNFDVTSLGEKSLMATWEEGFGSAKGAMVGGKVLIHKGIVMTANNAPSPELCFATNANASQPVWKCFDNVKRVSNESYWQSTTTPSDDSPIFLGRKNNDFGIIKGVRIESTFSSNSVYKVEKFAIVGSNSTITDQTSFNNATWDTLATFESISFIGKEVRDFLCASNTTNYGWVGIKIMGSSGNVTCLTEIEFLSEEVQNELKSEVSHHVFVLKNPIADTYDWCVDTSPTGANILSNSAITAAGFTKFRRVFSFAVDKNNQIPSFLCYDERSNLKTLFNNPGTQPNDAYFTLSQVNGLNKWAINAFNHIPKNINLIANIGFILIYNAVGGSIYVGDPDLALNQLAYPNNNDYIGDLYVDANSVLNSFPSMIGINTNKAYIVISVSSATGTMYIREGNIRGYIDPRID